MLPTPLTSHVAFDRVYEPAEDSYLLLDTLSSTNEVDFLHQRFDPNISSPSPVVAEIGTGSGVIIAFVNAHAGAIFGRSDILTLGLDVNIHACTATEETVRIAEDTTANHGTYIGNVVGDLTMSLRNGLVDVLIFNPPYVPTSELPMLPGSELLPDLSHERNSYLLSLSYAGGEEGMETTKRVIDLLPQTLSSRGVAYILLCAQNKPEQVKTSIVEWGSTWRVDTVGSSGKKAGWEKLQIIRIWRNRKAEE